MASKILSCYYSFNRGLDLRPEEIDGDLMTHLIVGWTGVDATTGKITATPEDIAGFKRCAQLKTKYPHLKVMVVCGDGAMGTMGAMANDSTLISQFVKSSLQLLETCGLDGLDLDWEFPVWGKGRSCDKANFTNLLQNLRDAFGSKYLLTAAVGAPKLIMDVAYDIPAISNYLDFINLMTYDFNLFVYYNPFAGHNAPLFARPGQKMLFHTMNTAWSADEWNAKGMPKNKIVVGIPTYARSWNLLTSCVNCYNAPCTGGGSMTYPQVLDILENESGHRVFDEDAKVPYLVKKDLWISYEDEESIAGKAKWIQQQQFGGAMIFDLNSDDYNGIFSKTGVKFPLVATVADIFQASAKLSSFPVTKPPLP